MAKRTALPLQYLRMKNLLPDAELIRLAEKVKGKPLSTEQKQDRGYLVDNVLIPEISRWVSCMYGKGYEHFYDHNLYRAVQATARHLGLGTWDEIQTLSNEEICGKIQDAINATDYERILHLSEEERILTLRSIIPEVTPEVTHNSSEPLTWSQVRRNYSSYRENQGLFGTLYNPITSILMRGLPIPKTTEIIKQGSKFVGQAIQSGDAGKFLKEETPIIKEKLIKRADDLKEDIIDGIKEHGPKILIGAAVALVAYGAYKLAEPQIKEKIVEPIKRDMEAKALEKERRMVDVVAELVACLCFNPYAILDLDADSAYETMRRSYVAELNKVHPDLVVGLSAEEQASAYQRMKELRIAWEIIQTEKGVHPSF